MRKLVVLAITGFTVAALSTPAAQAKSVATTHFAATTTEAARTVTAFWTPERMRSAKPLDLLDVAPGAIKDVARGLPTVVPGAAIQSFPNGGAAWTSGGAVVKTAGRVFFTYQNRTASCSGDAVTSANKSTVMTAGHCVKLGGAFHTNWAFVPGYDNGSTPYGTWTAKSTHATPQWVASEDINYDIGAAVVNQLNGQNLTDVVGAQGIAFNQARGQNMYAFGYPAAAPYDGTKLIYCSGKVFNDFLLSQGIGMTCDQTGGASGGPWFLSFDEGAGTGIQNSVNSFKYNFFPNWMFGPYFGADAQNLYNTAQAG
ncbi:peptidase [Actinosynnema sp. ALI-1.44]|uniref:trypsin-like serine peptidase n=1 Tax=Actinosynnema sp. ALI-1.44 TaxID=1933779 RepID=UPI00097C7B27|nr:peptidase [Actinosynnema sp. ALI-1.44]ONI89867.1 peptidase [Actinosynnema sp. ALI-1.44]